MSLRRKHLEEQISFITIVDVSVGVRLKDMRQCPLHPFSTCVHVKRTSLADDCLVYDTMPFLEALCPATTGLEIDVVKKERQVFRFLGENWATDWQVQCASAKEPVVDWAPCRILFRPLSIELSRLSTSLLAFRIIVDVVGCESPHMRTKSDTFWPLLRSFTRLHFICSEIATRFLFIGNRIPRPAEGPG